MMDENQQSILKAMMDLADVENRLGETEAIRIATATLCGALAFIEHREGNSRAIEIARELYRTQLSVGPGMKEHRGGQDDPKPNRTTRRRHQGDARRK